MAAALLAADAQRGDPGGAADGALPPGPVGRRAAVALVAAAFGLAGSAWLLRGDRRLAPRPASPPTSPGLRHGRRDRCRARPGLERHVDQRRARSPATLAWFLLGTLVLAASLVVRGDRLGRRHGAASADRPHRVAEAPAARRPGPRADPERVALAGIAVAVLGAVLVELDRRARPRSRRVCGPACCCRCSRPPLRRRTRSSAGSDAVAGARPGRRGRSPASVLGMCSGCRGSRAPARSQSSPLPVVELETLALATSLTPTARVDELVQRSVTRSWLLLGLTLAWLPRCGVSPPSCGRPPSPSPAASLAPRPVTKFGVRRRDRVRRRAAGRRLAAAVAVAGCATTPLLAARRVAADLALAAIPLQRRPPWRAPSRSPRQTPWPTVRPTACEPWRPRPSRRRLPWLAWPSTRRPQGRRRPACSVSVLLRDSVLVVHGPHAAPAGRRRAGPARVTAFIRSCWAGARVAARSRYSRSLRRAPHLARRRPARGRGRARAPSSTPASSGRPPGRRRRRACPGRGRGAY